MRRLRRANPGAVILFEDETTLRWFPPLRGMWARRGEQARVPITGRNAKRVLFGTINMRTGHRILLRRPQGRQADFQAFLRLLRRRYGGRRIYLLLDKGPCHDTKGSRATAAELEIELVWLPKQWSELNAMDQLWRELKRLIAANRQAASVDALASDAADWVLGLTPQQARRKAGMTSKHFWLRNLVEDFWLPT